MEGLLKYANCTEETMQAKKHLGRSIARRQKDTLDFWILENGFSYPQNRSERRGFSRGRLVRKSNPR